jgi:glucan phosphoethanolaminetransferase (alkaline phosphatase superfamily)
VGPFVTTRPLAIAADTKAALLAAALMFLWALLLGVWKYRQIATSADHRAHPYVDIAHRAALLYSFALLLVATFVQLSGWSELANLLAAGAMTLYFYAAVATYTVQGWRRVTDNQFRDPVRGTHAFMIALIVAEIGGWLVLIAGFLDRQVF